MHSNLTSDWKRQTRLTFWWLTQIWISIKLQRIFLLPLLQWTKPRIQASKSPFRTCQNIGWRTSWRTRVANSWIKRFRPSLWLKTWNDGKHSRTIQVPKTKRLEISLTPKNVEERLPSVNPNSSRTRTILAISQWLESLSETRSKSCRKSLMKKIS